MQPSPRNIRRWGSIRVRNALPAEAAMKASSPPIMSIRFGLLETPTRACLGMGAIRTGAFDPACDRAGSDQPIRNESVHPAGSRCA
jgi:hypothetical protein